MSLHDTAEASLQHWAPPDRDQRSLRDRFLAHLEAHPDGVWRNCEGEHLTAGVLVVDHTVSRVLMSLHGKAGIWVAFGGHCEAGDSTLLAAATRELIEESGLSGFEVDPVIAQLDVHPVDFCRPHGSVNHLDVRFVARAAPDATHQASDESTEVRWFDFDAVPTREPQMRELIQIAAQRFG